MNIDAGILQDALRRIEATVRVEPVDSATLRVTVADHRQRHQVLTLALAADIDGWELSDAGHTAFLLGEDFDEVAGAMECAGAPVEADGSELVCRVHDHEDVAGQVLEFASAISAAPMVWHSLACASRPSRNAPLPSVRAMAKEARAHLSAVTGRSLDRLMPLDAPVHGALDRVRAPLQLRTKRGRPPRVLMSCIDLTAAPQAVTSAKSAAAFLWTVTRDLPDLHGRFEIARGAPDELDRLTEVYDRDNVAVIPSDDLGLLSEAVKDELATVGL